MNKDYYTLKEIVFGLRNEQLRVIEKLRELEKYVNISDNSKCKSVQLSITSIKELSYSCLVKYDNLLKRILDFVSGDFVEAIMGGYYVGFGQVKNDSNGKYIFHGGVTVKDEDQEVFGIKVKELLSDEFVQNMDYRIKFHENECSASSLSLAYGSILYRGSVDLHNYESESMFYTGEYDEISVDNELNKNHKEFINEMLNLNIPRKLIPEYLQSVIDGNDNTKKDIIIPNTMIHTKKTWFNIKEEPNAFVLVKKQIPTKK